MFIQQNSSGDIAGKKKKEAEIFLFLEFTFKGKDTNNTTTESKSVLYICVSFAALHIGSLLLSF